MNELLITIGGFAVMGMLCALLERVWPENAQQPAWRSDSGTDVAYFALRVVLSGILVLLTAGVGASLPADSSPELAGKWPLTVQVIGVVCLTDFLGYWVHRLHHHVKALWWMHAVHHAPRQIDWLVAARVHPVELVIGKIFATTPIYLLGFQPEAFAIAVPMAAVYSLFLHANVDWGYGPLGYVIASPAFHRWHHSAEPAAVDKNFAQVLSLYDFLLGTAYFPRDHHTAEYGVRNETVPEGVIPQLFYPLQRLRDFIRTRRGRPSRLEAPVEAGLPAERTPIGAGHPAADENTVSTNHRNA